MPFTALFGRDPIDLPELENPELSCRVPWTGSTFLTGFRDRLRDLWRSLKAESDRLKAVRQQRQLSKINHSKTVRIEVGDLVWLAYGSKERAARLRKSGRGAPWRHQYKVVGLSDFGVKIEPTPGAPIVKDWQPRHKVTKTPPDFNDDHRSYSIDPDTGLVLVDPLHVRMSTENPLNRELDGPPPDDDGAYTIEDIIHAEKLSGQWHLTIKWEGYSKPTVETRAWLKRNSGTAVQALAEEAIRRAVLAQQQPGEIDVDDDNDDEPHGDAHGDEDDDTHVGGYLLRVPDALLASPTHGTYVKQLLTCVHGLV